MPDAPITSTLAATETAFRRTVLAVTVGCDALVLALLALAPWRAHPLLSAAGAVLSLAPCLSNLLYLRNHTNTTVGMMPVAVFSLAPALLVAGVSPLPPAAHCACVVMGLLAVGLLALFAFWCHRLRRSYQARPLVTSDAALIVLGGTVRLGQPCETLARRLDVAARLWHEGPARTIVVTGGPTPDLSTTEADVMARYLQEHGVDTARVLLERTARNTRENMRRSTELLDSRGFAGQRCVVSSDYHLWRALRDARAEGATLTPIAAPTPRLSAPQQWCREVLTILVGR